MEGEGEESIYFRQKKKKKKSAKSMMTQKNTTSQNNWFGKVFCGKYWLNKSPQPTEGKTKF